MQSSSTRCFCQGPSLKTSETTMSKYFQVAAGDEVQVTQEFFCSCVHWSIQRKKKSKVLCHHCVSDWVQTRVHLPGCRPPPQWKPHGDQESWLVPELEVPPARKCLQTQQDIIMPKTPLVILKLLVNTYTIYTFKNETSRKTTATTTGSNNKILNFGQIYELCVLLTSASPGGNSMALKLWRRHFKHRVVSSYLWISGTPGLTQGWRCSPGPCRGTVPPGFCRLSCGSSCSCSVAPQVSVGPGTRGTRERAPKVHTEGNWITELRSTVYTVRIGFWLSTSYQKDVPTPYVLYTPYIIYKRLLIEETYF